MDEAARGIVCQFSLRTFTPHPGPPPNQLLSMSRLAARARLGARRIACLRHPEHGSERHLSPPAACSRRWSG